MRDLAEEAVRAGAVGFSSSRIQRHLSLSGKPIPGTYAPEQELQTIAEGIARGGGAVLQAVPSNATDDAPGVPPEYSTMVDEIAMFSRISRSTGLPVSLTTLQLNTHPTAWRDALKATALENSNGAFLRPQVAARPATMLTLLEGYHLFMRRPTFLSLAHLPVRELARRMKDPATKEAILREEDLLDEHPGAMRNRMPRLLELRLAQTFPVRVPIDYEPELAESILSQASAQGRDPLEFMYDLLIEDEGTGAAMVLLANYIDGDLEACRAMLTDENTVSGLGDAGAHVKFICDMSLPTFLLTHWVRDRVRGARIPIETVVAKQTFMNAELFGMRDRGSIEVGKRADLNVIDLNALTIERPRMHHDLPGGGSRLLQRSTGYIATIVQGVVARSHDSDTGARPGALIRNHR
jgi:N-acyl-D-aspartate/D-glutamate deacylase